MASTDQECSRKCILREVVFTLLHALVSKVYKIEKFLFEVEGGTHTKFEEQLDHLFKLSTNIRGSFLDQAIPIEWFIDDIISQHFCPEETRRLLYFSSVPPELTFLSKIKIFKTLLKICYPDLLKKHPNLMKEIEKIRVFRNRIAHSMLEATDEFLKKGYEDRIRLEYFRNGKKQRIVVKTEDMKERLRDCTRVVFVLKDIQKEVIQRVQTEKK